MSASPQVIQTIRQFLDTAFHRSMRERVHFAKATGLSMPQFGILMQLHYCTQCGISDISQRFDITAAAASQLVEKLVQSGLIERAEDPNDRRVKQITLTSRGRAMIEKGMRERHRWLDQLVMVLDAKDRAKVAEALTILTEAAQKLERA